MFSIVRFMVLVFSPSVFAKSDALPAFTPEKYAQGAKLYELNCRKCHRDLSRSERLGSKIQSIRWALENEMEMMSLWGKFKEEEIQALAVALNNPFQAALSPPKTKADALYKEKHPKIYELARKYFPSDLDKAPQKRLFRLTQNQIESNLKYILPEVSLGKLSGFMPKEPLQTNYEYAESLQWSSGNLKPYSVWYENLLAAVRKQPSLLLSCGSPQLTESCLGSEVRRVAIKFFRGDVTDARLSKLVAFHQESTKKVGLGQATGDLLEYFLNSPRFLYRSEVATDESGRLRGNQALSALTYTLADLHPDQLRESLRQSPEQFAEKGKTKEGVTELVREILGTKESREKLIRFFKAWLEIKNPEEFRISTLKFPEFSPTYAKSITADAEKILRDRLYQSAPTLNELRELLTSAAVIASHSGPDSTRLIKRGVFWVRKLMCMELAPPPPGIDTNIPKLENATERQIVEKATSSKNCQACHKVINPFGFALESLDVLGRPRVKDNGLKIDTKVEVNFLDEAPFAVSTTQEFIEKMTASAMFKQCFIRQMFRYYMGRNEEESDHPALRVLFYQFQQNDSLDVIRLLQAMGNSSRLIYRGD